MDDAKRVANYFMALSEVWDRTTRSGERIEMVMHLGHVHQSSQATSVMPDSLIFRLLRRGVEMVDGGDPVEMSHTLAWETAKALGPMVEAVEPGSFPELHRNRDNASHTSTKET